MKIDERQKYITVGIAGHVDHGKTSLVRCLTGIDTDRWGEEKRRGLSIESGIATLELSSGINIALVDVPGHSDYLKNTIRGLSSVDMAILIVAADDGVMPQTFEHISLLNFFRVKDGFVVLSKADLVDDETLELARFEINETVQGTFLEGKPIIPFSALDRRGVDEILLTVAMEEKRVEGKSFQKPFRLWIDQVRSFPGFGNVVSGTVLSGTIRQDETVQLLPSGKEVRARFLEVHHQKVSQAVAGQRVGINLPKVSLEDVRRGMLLAELNTIIPSCILNTELSLPRNSPGMVKNRQRVKLYLGTSATNALVITMDRESLSSGGKGLVQFRLENPVAAVPKDPFVICSLNTHNVIGGGTVLEIGCEKFRTAKAKNILPYLYALQLGDVKLVIDQYFRKNLASPVMIQDLAKNTGLIHAEIELWIKKGIEEGRLVEFGDCGFFAKDRYVDLKKQVLETVENILSHNPLKVGVSAEEIKNKLIPVLDEVVFKKVLMDLWQEGKLVKVEGGYQIRNLSVKLSPEHEKLVALILRHAHESGFIHFSADTFWKMCTSLFDKNEIVKMLDYLAHQKKLVRLNNGRFLTSQAMEQIKEKVRQVIIRKGNLTLADSKEILGYGRTGGIPVLEYLDEIGFTSRRGDERVLKE